MSEAPTLDRNAAFEAFERMRDEERREARHGDDYARNGLGQRWKPYARDSEQAANGIEGRWQFWGEATGRWQNLGDVTLDDGRKARNIPPSDPVWAAFPAVTA